jgi:molybdenum cofactor cytidylyltransferase
MSDIAGSVAAIILAAGRSTRFAGDHPDTTKLVADLHGRPLVRHVADAALASRARPVIVVTGHARERVQEALGGLPLKSIHNENYASGLASSLRTGIAAVPSEAFGAVVLLGDMPLVTAALIDQLADRLEQNSGADAIVPITERRRGNPVLLARSLFPAVARLTGDEGARRLLEDPQLRVIEVPVAGAGASTDIDTDDQLALMRAEAGGATSDAATR